MFIGFFALGTLVLTFIQELPVSSTIGGELFPGAFCLRMAYLCAPRELLPESGSPWNLMFTQKVKVFSASLAL